MGGVRSRTETKVIDPCLCPLQGMMPPINEMLQRVAGEHGLDWEEFYQARGGPEIIY